MYRCCTAVPSPTREMGFSLAASGASRAAQKSGSADGLGWDVQARREACKGQAVWLAGSGMHAATGCEPSQSWQCRQHAPVSRARRRASFF